MKKRLYIESLGCPKNRVDTEVFLAGFLQRGWSVVNDLSEADLIVLNSCGFIEDARVETMDRFFTLYSEKREDAKIVMTGCLPQLYPEIKDQLTEADFIFGVDATADMAEVVERSWESGDHTVKEEPSFIYDNKMPRTLTLTPYTAYIKIADGCNNFCTYCSIPHIRGRYRERQPVDIEKEIKSFIDYGVREFDLIAQDTTRYGKTFDFTLERLLKRLDRIKGRFWLRIMYLYPSRIDRSLLQAIAESKKVLPYLEIPIQHVSDRVLREMNRNYGRKDIENLLRDIDDIFGENVVRRTSLITGFPKEKKEDFNELIDFINGDHFDYLGVFSYSKEEKSASGKFRRLPAKTVEARNQEATQAASESMERILQRFVGKEMDVLFEDIDHESMLCTGRGYHQAPEIDGTTILTNVENEKPGQILPVKIVDRDGIDFIAEIQK